MAVSKNEVTGEVTLELDGVEFVLKGSFARLADLQRRLDVPGFRAAMGLIMSGDMNALYQAMCALCSGIGSEEIDDLPLMKHLGEVQQAVSDAITAGMPDDEDGEGNAEGAVSNKTAGRPGIDTDK